MEWSGVEWRAWSGVEWEWEEVCVGFIFIRCGVGAWGRGVRKGLIFDSSL